MLFQFYGLNINMKVKVTVNSLVSPSVKLRKVWHPGGNRGILVYNICLISISNSVSDGATNKSVLNIESS